MKKEVFDILETIHAQTVEHYHKTGRKPETVSVSRNANRRLLEIKIEQSGDNGQPNNKCYAIGDVTTPTGAVALQIDELLNDTEIGIE
jgi:hypothetical protein